MIDGAADLPASMRQLIERLLENMKVLDRQVKELEAQIKAWHQGSELSRKLEKIPTLTVAMWLTTTDWVRPLDLRGSMAADADTGH